MGQTTGANALGARIRKRRQELGLTQEEVGQPLLSSAYVSLIESGDRRPSDEALGHIADRLETSFEELLTGRPAGLDVELELTLQGARRDIDHGRLTDAKSAVDQTLKKAKKNDFTRVEARAHEVLGALSERTEGPERAIEHYARAEELWRDEPAHLRYVTVTALARCTDQLGDPGLALHMLESYRHELTRSGKPHPVALMQTYTAMIYPCFSAGLPQKAAEAAREALSLEGRVDDPDQVACMHLTVARSLLFEGEYADALASIRKAEEIYLAGGWRNQVAKAQIAEAIVLSKKEDYEPAREKLLSSLELLDESPNKLDEALALNELGHVTRHLGDVDSALGYLRRARPLLDDSDVVEVAFNEREMGLCLSESDSKKAERHLKKAIDLYRVSGNTTELATTFKALGQFYARSGDTKKAIEALSDGLAAVEERAT
jgi:tetratricopeptide (TPR) repeat protein